MKEIKLKTPSYEGSIWIGEESLERIPALTQDQKNFVVTDENVYRLHAEFFKKYFAGDEVFVMQAGELNKSFQTLSKILDKMVEGGFGRNSRLFAVGGGVVGDIGGLAAALFARGISYAQIPTTLLSQIDSAVGGKTAVNHGGVKNSVGAFYQPTQTLVSPTFLNTLPARELKCGLGELVKYAVLNKQIYRSLLENKGRFSMLDLEYFEQMIGLCLQHKADVVACDEREGGARRSLNAGHTTGHAIEIAFGLSHGESVLYGLALETLIATQKGVCDEAYGQGLLSVVLAALAVEPFEKIDLTNVEEFAVKAKYDKKNSDDGQIVLAVAKAEGEWTLLALSYDEYCSALRAAVAKFLALRS